MSLRLKLFALAGAVILSSVQPSFAQHDHSSPAHAAIVVGDIEISGPFTRATLPNAPVAAGFLTIANHGGENDRLVAVESPIAKEGQIHEMAMQGDVMKMQHLPDGIVIPAGETLVLEPGGYHLMFMGLTGPIKEGDKVPVTLTFEKAGTVTIDLIAAGTAADAPAHGTSH